MSITQNELNEMQMELVDIVQETKVALDAMEFTEDSKGYPELLAASVQSMTVVMLTRAMDYHFNRMTDKLERSNGTLREIIDGTSELGSAVMELRSIAENLDKAAGNLSEAIDDLSRAVYSSKDMESHLETIAERLGALSPSQGKP